MAESTSMDDILSEKPAEVVKETPQQAPPEVKEEKEVGEKLGLGIRVRLFENFFEVVVYSMKADAELFPELRGAHDAVHEMIQNLHLSFGEVEIASVLLYIIFQSH